MVHALIPAIILLAPVFQAGQDTKSASITAKECEVFAHEIERMVAGGDSRALAAAFDGPALLEKVIAGVETKPAVREGFSRAMPEMTRQFAEAICNACLPDGSYRFLRVHDVGVQTRILFRLLSGDGVNYHDHVVTRSKDGSVKIADCYVFAMGETLAQSMNRSYARAAAEADPSFLDRLRGTEATFIKNVGKIKEMNDCILSGEAKKALAIFRALPESLQREKAFFFVRLQAAASLEDTDEYKQVLSDMEKLFPGDPALDLHCIDGLVLNKQWEAAIARIDRLEVKLDGDPYTDVMRGDTYMGWEKFDQAKSSYKTAVTREPSLGAAHRRLLMVALGEGDWDEAVRILIKLEKELHESLGDLERDPDYADFIKTDAYAKWKKARAGNG